MVPWGSNHLLRIVATMMRVWSDPLIIMSQWDWIPRGSIHFKYKRNPLCLGHLKLPRRLCPWSVSRLSRTLRSHRTRRRSAVRWRSRWRIPWVAMWPWWFSHVDLMVVIACYSCHIATMSLMVWKMFGRCFIDFVHFGGILTESVLTISQILAGWSYHHRGHICPPKQKGR